jgi:hypothetical protein
LLAIVASLQHFRIYAAGAKNLVVYSDYKNLTTFLTTKELTRREARWSEILGEYDFKIVYTLGKDNGRADAVSRRSDYMESKEIFNHNILRKNPDGTLSPNVQEFNSIQQVAEDENEEFPDEAKTRLQENQEQDCIRKHYDGPLQGHLGIEKTLELIRRHYIFPKMKDKVTKYIAKCADCQKNKSSRHAKYGTTQFSELPDAP